MDLHQHPTTTSAIFAGLAVSTMALDVALRPSGTSWRSANDEAGIQEVVERMQQGERPAWMVLESTGGLERRLVAARALAGMSVAVVNPRQVRACAKATGRLAKTDALDAAVLAHFAQTIPPTPRPLPAAQAQRLAALVERRQHLVNLLTAEKNRAQQALLALLALLAVQEQIHSHITWLEQALQELDTELDQTLQASPLWRERAHLLRSVPGIGPVTALTLIAELPELGQGSARARPSRSRPWLGWPRSTGTAAPGGAREPSGAVGATSEPSSPWPRWSRWSRCVITRSSASSTNGSWPVVNPSRWL